jgi:phytoene/squalene synthetase
VLHLLGLATPERLAWSDSVCAGLQIAEHLQDIGEDLAAGRVYLPASSMAVFDVDRSLLARVGTASVAERGRVAALLAGEADWARSLLDTPLVPTVPGRARLAVAGFVAGGRAALDAVLAAGPDAVHLTPRPTRLGFLHRLVGALR